jgi:plasmid maintenance system antidote protein VapI
MTYSSKVSQMLGKVNLDEKKINKRRLSLELGLSPSHVWKIFKGQRNLTADVALRLEKHSGVPAIDWLKLQAEDDLNAELIKMEKAPLNFNLPSSFEKKVQSYEAEMGIDDVLALNVGEIKVSHETSDNPVVAFNGNDETVLQILNNHEPCWIEKVLTQFELVRVKKFIIQFGVLNQMACQPKEIKIEGIKGGQYENIVLEEVQGNGVLQDNRVYVKILGDGRIEVYTKEVPSYKGYRLTLIGAGEQCALSEFKGYEWK